jgi:diacylglycerol O-acyltransferase
VVEPSKQAMTPRLSPLDTSFLEVESPTAHMHVGWVALFSPPEDRPAPTFKELREHIRGRLGRAPRYRQKLARVPLGLHDPVWVDDDNFDVRKRIRRARAANIQTVVSRVMSEPLNRDEPLWEIWIADKLSDGRIGIVGKAHHCMVDGIAAVELAALLLDPTPETLPPEPDSWEPAPPPSKVGLMANGIRDRALEQLDLVRAPAEIARSPKRVAGLADDAQRAARALASSLSPPAPRTMLNNPISPLRHLALVRRPLSDLKGVKGHFQATVNDVVLAASSGAMRRFLDRHGESPMRLKTMVPVSVRDGSAGELGNRISFVFIELPCDEPDPVRRMLHIQGAMSDAKLGGEPEGGRSVLRAAGFAPHAVQRMFSRIIASPRTFNLVVSNIPGPREPLYMRGCPLDEAYPVVPLAERHSVSIGVTTIKDDACFGVYADRTTLPDAELLASDIDESIDELLSYSG